MSPLLLTVIQLLSTALLAPLAFGLIRYFKARISGRTGMNPFLIYAQLLLGLKKENLLPPTSSWAFKTAPYVVLSSSIFLALSLPLVVLGGAGANYSHFLLFVGVLAFSGAFHAFGAIDAGGVMGGMGASRHMLIMCLSQPTLILVFLALAIRADTSLIDGMIMGAGVFGGPSFVLAALALMLIGLAENDRYPADNPETSLELTMIREAMVFHYSGPYLVMMDYAAMLKLVTFFLLVTNILSPFGLMTAESGVLGILLAALLAVVKVLLASLAVAIFESVVAKMRFYRLQEFLSGAFFIAFAAFALALVMP